MEISVFEPPPVPPHQHVGACECEPTIAYLRVSRVGTRATEDLLSPAIQLDFIDRDARLKGKRIVRLFCDIDKTGKTFTKRSIEKVISDIQRGVAKSVTVWKWSRWGRNVEYSLLYLGKVQAAGGRVDSATEDMDPTTAVGRFSRGIMMQVDELNSDLIGESWVSAHDQRRIAGLPHSGRARFGYQYVTGVAARTRAAHEGAASCEGCRKGVAHFVLHPAESARVVELYRRYVKGTSLKALTRELNSGGFVTAYAGPWTPQAVGQMLDTGFAAGYLRERSAELKAWYKANHKVPTNNLKSFDVWNPGKQPKLIDEETWQAYKSRRTAQAGLAPRERVAVHVLSGLQVCDGCARRLGTKYSGRNLSHQWVCGWRASLHPDYGVSINNGGSLGVVRQWVRDRSKPSMPAMEQLDDRHHRAIDKAEVGVTPRTRATVQGEIDRWLRRIDNLVDMATDETLTRDQFRIKRAEYEAEVATLRAELAELDAAPLPGGRPDYAVFKSLDEAWDVVADDPAELNALLAEVVGMIVVAPGRATAAERVRVVGRWEMPGWERWLAARRTKAFA